MRGSLASLVRTVSGQRDAEFLVQLTHCLLAVLEARAWWGWVGSKGKHVGALSRQGLLAPRAMPQGWDAQEYEEKDFPSWAAVGDPWAAVNKVLQCFA